MKIRELLEGDVIPMIPRKPGPRERVAKFRTLCPDCGKPMRGGTDTRTGKRVRICMNCYKTIDEHAIVVDQTGNVRVIKDETPRKHFQKALKTMKDLGVPREERLRQVKSYKLLKPLADESEEETRARQTAYDEHFGHGYDDFRHGVDRDDNPHARTAARQAWFDGWDERAREKAS